MDEAPFIATNADGWTKLIANCTSVVAEGMSIDETVQVGDTIEVTTADGPARVVVTPALHSAVAKRPG